MQKDKSVSILPAAVKKLTISDLKQVIGGAGAGTVNTVTIETKGGTKIVVDNIGGGAE